MFALRLSAAATAVVEYESTSTFRSCRSRRGDSGGCGGRILLLVREMQAVSVRSCSQSSISSKSAMVVVRRSECSRSFCSLTVAWRAF